MLKPREKFQEFGADGLSNCELISILLGSGVEGKSVFDVSKRVEKIIVKYTAVDSSSITELQKIKGIGKVKAQRIIVALELGRRIYDDKSTKLLSTRDVWLLTRSMLTDNNEKVFVLYLNGKNQLLGTKEIASGGHNSTYIDVRILIKRAIELLATGIILVHNHPSGDIKPSTSDIVTTRSIRSACELMGIRLLDHVIITTDSYFSINE